LLSHEKCMMRTLQAILVWAFILFAMRTGWAQAANTPQPTDNNQQTDSTQTAPQSAGTSTPQQPQINENPPISGLDQPPLGPASPARSFLIPGAHVSESVDSNVGQTTDNAAIGGVTRALGSLMFQKLGNRSVTALDYIGGATIYSNFSPHVQQVHQFDVQQKFLWHTGQLAVRDMFSYLPEGSFGYGEYGESGAYNLGLGGIGYIGGSIGEELGGIFGLGEFGALGQQPRIDNATIVDLAETLTKRSSITLAGGYALLHFTGDTPGFVDSNQTTAQAGYDYQLTRRSQLSFVYGFQRFEYPDVPGSSFDTHVMDVLYGHRITGRMDLLFGGGPQITVISNPLSGNSSNMISASARAALRYRFPKTTLGIYYDRYNSAGSGFYLGATSDVVRFSATRPLGRKWTGNADVGYSHNSQIRPVPVFIFQVQASQSFQYVYAGAAVQRQLTKSLSFFVSYQYNDLSFDSSFCAATLGACSTISQRHVASIGLDWRPHPIRLD